VVTGKHNGHNFSCSGLNNVTISFSFDNDDYTADIPITFTVPESSNPVAAVSGTLPVLYINVYDENGNFNNEIIDKDLAHKNYFSGKYWLDLNGCDWEKDLGAKSIGSANEPLDLEIKARGNYTRTGFSKKPFKLKLGKKQKMLGLSNSKHFTLLAHADDNCGYMRNFVGFNLGRRIGLPWTPSEIPVEVVINGDYRGLYFLTESIRVEADRINIAELDDNVSDPELISGGYIVELDNYNETNQIQMQERTAVGGYTDMLRVTWDTPEEYSDMQKRFITDQFSNINDAIGTDDDTAWSYLDLDDAVRYYIVEELFSHTESYHGSTYLYRDRGEGQKWHFSPLWDCGNAFNGPTDGYFYRNSPFGNTWIPSMRINDTFNTKLYDTWLWFMSTAFDGLIDDINLRADRISAAAKADHVRWHNAPLPNSSNATAVQDNSDMAQRTSYVINHISAKAEWLKGKFGDYSTGGPYDEPLRDTTTAAPLPDYATTAIAAINADSDTPVYYNLQGIQVSQPLPGNVYIVRRATSATKEIYR
jgi:hypothetical protein